MARQHGGFYINVKSPPGIKIRNELGRFTSAQTELYERNRQLAADLRYQVARRIENSLQRPKVSSHRLVRVTDDPKNAVADRYFMGVGNEDFLNKSIAKYWRTVEEGTAKTWTKRSFTTLPLQGLWGMNVGAWDGPVGDPWIGLRGKTERGDRPGQEMYHPFRKGPGANLPVFHPKKDTTPMHAYRAVAQSPDLSERSRRAAANFWNMILGRGFRPGNAPFE